MAYRLIWFQHFHKAAGSAVVEAAASNGETFWPGSLNGNPTDASGHQLKLWEFDDSALTRFVDQCEERGVTFVATEWGLPNLDVLANDERVFLVTCLRDPLARYVSNFYYDLHNGYTAARSLSEFKNTRQRVFTMDNYYCRILASIEPSQPAITDADFELSTRNLGRFNYVGFADARLSQLAAALNWRNGVGTANVNKPNFKTLLSLFLRFRWKLVYLRLRYPKSPSDTSFADAFMSENEWDYRLLQWADANANKVHN